MRRLLTLLLLMIASAAMCYSQQWSDKDLDGLEVYRIKSDSQYYKDLVGKLGDILIAYKYGGLTYRNSLGDFINVFEYLYFLAEKNGKIIFLGKIEKSKVIDAFGKVLYDASKDDPRLFPNSVGISSSILRTLTQPALVGVGGEKPGMS